MKYGISHKDDPAEWHRRSSQAQRDADPLLNAFKTAKSRAKKRGLEFNIERSDLKMPEVCPVFGIEIIPARGYRTDNSPSLDRIDNSKGYIKGNVAVVSWLANCRKGDLSLEQLEALVKYIKDNT